MRAASKDRIPKTDVVGDNNPPHNDNSPQENFTSFIFLKATTMNTLITHTAPIAAAETVQHVLIVDDVSENLEVLGHTLHAHGIKILAAQSGSQALAIAAHKKPALILLDIQMPVMDGFMVCQELKANPETRDIPIIFLTARTGVEDIVQGFKLGAVDYLTKPINTTELLARVRTHLEMQRLRADMMLQNYYLQQEVLERRRAQEELECANEHLRELNKQKNEFLGIAVHDLKNPLSGITALARAVRQLPDMEREEIELNMQHIMSTTERMFELIKNLLNVNAIEQGGMRLTLSPVNLTLSAAMTLQSYNLKACAKSITLKTEISSDVVGVCDEAAIVQVFDNLISNALKFSPEGSSITVRTYQRGDKARFEVQDEGPGLTAEDKAKLFGKFARLSAKPTGGENSTGLGLSIVKTMVEAMGGHVWCESTVGEGAVFIVEVPIIPEECKSSENSGNAINTDDEHLRCAA